MVRVFYVAYAITNYQLPITDSEAFAPSDHASQKRSRSILCQLKVRNVGFNFPRLRRQVFYLLAFPVPTLGNFVPGYVRLWLLDSLAYIESLCHKRQRLLDIVVG